MNLYHGDYRTVLAIEQANCLITDPPYGERTHNGRRTGQDPNQVETSSIPYAPLTRKDVRDFVAFFLPRISEWWVLFGDEETSGWWLEEMSDAGLYTFSRVIWCKPDATPRLTGDGPASACEYIAVARTRHMPKRPGSRPGYYECGTSSTKGNNGKARSYPGTKPIQLMRALVRDYSSKGDLVIDPFAGTGTTLLAAITEGRDAIGAELSKEAYALASKRLRAGYTPTLPGVA